MVKNVHDHASYTSRPPGLSYSEVNQYLTKIFFLFFSENVHNYACLLDSRTGQSFIIPEGLGFGHKGIRSGIFRMFEEMPFMDKLVHLMKPQICNCQSTKISIGGTSDI